MGFITFWFWGLGLKSCGVWALFGYGPHTVTVYSRAAIKVLSYLYNEYDPTVTERGQYPKALLFSGFGAWGF